MSEPRTVNQSIGEIAAGVERRFQEGRRVLSFSEYLELFATNPARYARDASQYVKDTFDHFGTREVTYPWGPYTRFRLFDLPWEQDEGPKGLKPKLRGMVVGQEHVQEEMYRALSNFVREGRPNRLVLLHGPNGSAKSTIVGAVLRALENYSTQPEGALYRFNWVFPTSSIVKSAVGFGGGPKTTPSASSYAHLADDQIDAKLLVEVRDHPLFLIPLSERQALLSELKLPNTLSDWLLRGELSSKSQQIFEALLASYKGSYSEVLKHVQVERYFISQRYRMGAVTIGPQMSVDAGERQITADRSLGSLPASLQALTLYEARGELVDAAGGVLEFSDLLKRPLDAFKYLQLTVETGEVALSQQNIQLNCVMMGSANELHLDAFREHPEFPSFRGRLELLRTSYLRSYIQEQSIYDSLVIPQIQRHVAPHASRVAALFAVLTRMRKPDAAQYVEALRAPLAQMTVMEKARLYAEGVAPDRFDHEQRQLVVSRLKDIYEETDSYPIYEGRVGASPREMRVLLLDAAQSTAYRCLSPLAVLDEIEQLCTRGSEFEWLQQEGLPGGFHNTETFRADIQDYLLLSWETEMYAASGIVEDSQAKDVFERYIQHVGVWVKKERIRNKLTSEFEEPDESLMREVEALIDIKVPADEWRKQVISTVAAWAIDHSDKKVEPSVIFAHLIVKIQASIFASRRPVVAQIARDLVVLVREEGKSLEAPQKRIAEASLARLESRYNYCSFCAADMAAMLMRKRFSTFL
jgi:serine protein kinase